MTTNTSTQKSTGIYTFIWFCFYVYTYVYIYMYMYVYIRYIYMYMYVYIRYMYISTYIQMYMGMYMHRHKCIHVVCAYDRFHWKCYTNAIHQNQKLKFLSTNSSGRAAARHTAPKLPRRHRGRSKWVWGKKLGPKFREKFLLPKSLQPKLPDR